MEPAKKDALNIIAQLPDAEQQFVMGLLESPSIKYQARRRDTARTAAAE